MDHNRDDIRTLSEPKQAARYIFALLIIAIVSALSLLLAVGAWNRKLYIVATMLIIQMIILIIVLTIHFGDDFIKSVTKVSFSEKGIVCTLLGSTIKSFPWESIKYILVVRNMHGKILGPIIQERFREYCVFSTEELKEDYIAKDILNENAKTEIAVIPLNEKLMKRLQSQYDSFYRHARVEVPVLIGENSQYRNTSKAIQMQK